MVVLKILAALGRGLLLGFLLFVLGEYLDLHIASRRYVKDGRPCLVEYKTSGAFTACGNRQWYPVSID